MNAVQELLRNILNVLDEYMQHAKSIQEKKFTWIERILYKKSPNSEKSLTALAIEDIYKILKSIDIEEPDTFSIKEAIELFIVAHTDVKNSEQESKECLEKVTMLLHKLSVNKDEKNITLKLLASLKACIDCDAHPPKNDFNKAFHLLTQLSYGNNNLMFWSHYLRKSEILNINTGINFIFTVWEGWEKIWPKESTVGFLLVYKRPKEQEKNALLRQSEVQKIIHTCMVHTDPMKFVVIHFLYANLCLVRRSLIGADQWIGSERLHPGLIQSLDLECKEELFEISMQHNNSCAFFLAVCLLSDRYFRIEGRRYCNLSELKNNEKFLAIQNADNPLETALSLINQEQSKAGFFINRNTNEATSSISNYHQNFNV